jgi:hypothetical protein
MENLFTQSTLEEFNKPKVLEIALSNGIAAKQAMTKEEIIALILEKGVLVQTETPQGVPQEGTPPADAVEADSLPKFSKEQLLKSSTYSHRRDVLQALLTDDGMYSHAEVTAKLKEFYNKAVT